MCLWTLKTIPRTEKTERRKREEKETLHNTALHYMDTHTHTEILFRQLLAAILLSKSSRLSLKKESERMEGKEK